MRISSVEKLRDQGSNGSLAYEFATKVAKAFADRFVNGRFPWTCYFSAAILENVKVFRHKRALQLFNDAYVRECSSRASPNALLGVSIGAREAKISFRTIYEIENVIHKIRTNPQAA